MSSASTKDAIMANLRFDKKSKEGSVLGDSYIDVKSFIQFYEETKRQLEVNQKKADIAINLYKSKPRQIRYELIPDPKRIGDFLDLAHSACAENRPADALGLIETARHELENPSRHIVQLDIKDNVSWDSLNDDLDTFQAAIQAGALLHASKGAFEHLEALKAYEDNWGTKQGVDQIRKVVQNNEMLFGLMLSTPREEDREKAKVVR